MSTTVGAATTGPIATLLAGVNSPASVGAAQPLANICASTLFASLCNGTVFSRLRVVDGCATVNSQCLPETLRTKRCIVSGQTVGGYTFVRSSTSRVTPFFDANTADTSSEAAQGRRLLQRVRQATFQSCCVSPKQREPATGTASTCRRINVGKKFTSLGRFKPTTCRCANVREFVQSEMCVAHARSRPSRPCPAVGWVWVLIRAYSSTGVQQ
jgi:hypothetical protein